MARSMAIQTTPTFADAVRMKPVTCPKCGSASAMRINRNGFLQRQVLGHFGIYPWKCGACGQNFLYRRRKARAKLAEPTA
jgi:predicted RNA-binding Zn-ribbon protein involved in translation (DUF1610 family)